MSNKQEQFFLEKKKLIDGFLEKNNYAIVDFLGNPTHGTFTYTCEVLGMRFHIKLCLIKKQNLRKIGSFPSADKQGASTQLSRQIPQNDRSQGDQVQPQGDQVQTPQHSVAQQTSVSKNKKTQDQALDLETFEIKHDYKKLRSQLPQKATKERQVVEFFDVQQIERYVFLRNELDVYKQLWQKYPEGNLNSFILPPGPDDVFGQQLDAYMVFGYSRFRVQGEVLGKKLRNQTEEVADWIDTFASMTQEIDTLPNLSLPKTQIIRRRNYNEIVIKNIKKWQQNLLSIFDKTETDDPGLEEIINTIQIAAEKSKEYFTENQIPKGTVHGHLIPDEILVSSYLDQPYLLSFTKLNQAYPRFFDIAKMYSWLVVVLGASEPAHEYWHQSTNQLNENDQIYLQMLTNEILLGTLLNYLQYEKKEINLASQDFWV
jgi:hypothetical protein